MPRSSTAPFFALAFLFTWALQLPGVFARWGWLPGDADGYLPFAMLGIFGPLAAAAWLTHRESGRDGLRALFGRLLLWRVPPRFYVAALVLPGALLSLGLWAMNLAGRSGPAHYLPGVPQLIAGIVISIGEEVGWRGYALPRLSARYGAFGASGILGVLWAIWHIPMFLAVGIPMTLAPVMLLFFVGGSLYFTWIHQRTGGSLLLVVLAHLGAHLNNSNAALPADTLPLLIHTVVYAGLGLALMRTEALGVVRGKPPLRVLGRFE